MNKMNEKVSLIFNEIKKSVIGKDDCILKVMSAILAGGHILIEDIPGVGKTTLAIAFSNAMHLECNRVQFTPDVLPADINGFSLYQKETGQFVYQPGTILCNLFLADEINRTSPKTQSALLEVMEERHVTVDGITHDVPSPFVVIATQNPSGSAGTQLLPESQLDRFMIRTSMGYPNMEHEIEILKGKNSAMSAAKSQSVISQEDLIQMKKEVENVFLQDELYVYIANLVRSTREHPMISLGVSPRGSIALTKISKALAYINGRNYVLPEDISLSAADTLLHRIRLDSKARINHIKTEDILHDIVNQIKKPSIRKE